MAPAVQQSKVDSALAALAAGRNRDPFAVLGPHSEKSDEAGGPGVVVRAFFPAALSVDVYLPLTGEIRPMSLRHPAGVFQARIAGPDEPGVPDYRLRVAYSVEHVVEIDDPYRYGRVLTDYDLHLLGEGTHHRSFEKLGAHRIKVGATTGVHFAVWAPNAGRVSVIGDFNGWDGRVHPMRLLVPNGIWEIFFPDLPDGERYKFEIL